MDVQMLEKLIQQHIDNYRKGIVDIIHNNTNMFIDDIVSFVGKPPLDSMDYIQKNFLDIAKKNKIVFNTKELNTLLDNYRSEIIDCCEKIKEIRLDNLLAMVDCFSFDNFEIFSFYKKNFTILNRKMRNTLKTQIMDSFEGKILPKIDTLFSDEVTEDCRNKVIQEITKYVKNNYLKQVIDTFEMKLLVKDTILINGVREQSDRYIFTINNSRLLNNLD